VNSYTLLGALQRFVEQRNIAVVDLTAEPAIGVMLDWFRLIRVDKFAQTGSRDALVFRYGGWSEGCATGYRFSLLRRVTEKSDSGGDTEWFAGITLLFEPSSRSELAAFSTTSTDWESLDAFAQAIWRSPGFRALVAEKPMGAFLESGGLRLN
jgi:hypothetical protein